MNEIQDERILLERRKIQSIGYAWIMNGLLIAIIVQQLFMKAPFAQYAVELFILIGCGLYNIISNFQKGIDIWNPSGEGKKKLLGQTILLGFVFVILLSCLGDKAGMNHLMPYFITFIVCFAGFRFTMIEINNKKQQAIDKSLNENEMNV